MAEEKKYIIPYIDQPSDFWDRLFTTYQKYIKEVYFPAQIKNIGSGRPLQPSLHIQKFIENDAVPKSVLINPIILPASIDKIGDIILKYLHEIIPRYHIVGVSVVNLDLAKIIRLEFPAIQIIASTLMDISSGQQVLMIKDHVSVIVPSGRVSRDLKRLKEIRFCFHGKIRLIVNESCIPNCLYRTQHFFEMADPSNNHPESLCDDLLKQFPWMRLTGSWVLPQHLHFFDGLYDEIKIDGRVTLRNPQNYIEVLDSYIFRKKLNILKLGGGPASVTDGIEITDEFYSYTLHCNKNCSDCTVCQDYWNENLTRV